MEFCAGGAGIGPGRGSGVAMLTESPWSELEVEAMGGRGREDPNHAAWKGKVINC